MGNISVAIKKRNRAGTSRIITADLTMSSSYATGGDSITVAACGLEHSIDTIVAPPTAGLLFEYDATNKKLKALYPTGGAAASPGALAAPAVSSGASTASAVDATTPTLIPGQGKEVASTTNLSTIVIRATISGDNPNV